jgi:chitinase
MPGASSVWVEEETGEVGGWSASKTYNSSDEVIFDGNNYQAKWWTKGDQPGNANGPWKRI